MTQRCVPQAEARRGADVRESGMTLIELMVAMVILGVVIAAALNVGQTIMSGFRDHRRAMAVERAARGAMGVLSEAVRNASPGLANADILDLVGCTTLKGIEVINSSTESDKLRVVSAKGGAVTSTREVFDQDATDITVLDGSAFSVGDQAIITDFTKAIVVEIKTIAEGTGETTLGLTAAPSACGLTTTFEFDVLSTVLRAQVAEYSVDDTGDVPVLMMDPDGAGASPPEAVADGIEDLQIAIGIDQFPVDGSVGDDVAAAGDDDEWVYNHPDDSPPLLSVTARPYRALRMTVTARSIGETTEATTSLRPPAEDRAAADEADVYRRRSLSATAEIRNLQGSPL